MKKLHEIRLLVYSVGLLFSSAIERFVTYFINVQLNIFDRNIIFHDYRVA